jgi:alkanesulfonate monooxygenase SsuD/methylene tetrahydromethanopterin reductase-like flavin-dependent oxidoreductase (luciferase family)
MGTSRHLYIADTDEQALAIARRAYRRWIESFLYLWKRHNLDPIYATYPGEIDGLIEQERAYVGTPATVRRLIERQIESAGINYVLMRFAYGDMTLAESMRSLELFRSEVMPAFG